MALDLRSTLPLVLGAAGIGFGIATLLARDDGEVAPSPESVPEARPARVSNRAPRFERSHSPGVDEATLRRVVREELSEALKSAPRAASPAPDQDELAPAPDPEAIAVFEKARQTVDSGIRAGVWSNSDREELRNALRKLPGNLHHDVTEPLLAAVNQDRVRVDTDGPLF